MDQQLVAAYAEITAAQARILGMQAENQMRASIGASPAYTEQAFQDEAIGLHHISNALHGR